MQKIKEIYKNHWPIFIIVALAFFARIIKLEELFYFTYDESVFAFIGRRLALWHHLPLIGGVTPFGFHVAPYFYWFFSATLILGNLNPLIWGFLSALIGAATTFIIYIVAKDFFSKKVGTYASILWSFSALANIYDRHFWGITFGPLFSLLTIFLVKKIIDKKDKYLIPLALSLALIIHADLSYYVFIVFTVVAWAYYKLPLKKLLIIFLFAFISFTPIYIFDIRHNFANSKPILAYLSADRSNSRFKNQGVLDRSSIFSGSLIRFIYPFSDNEVSKQYSYCASFIAEKYENIPKVLSLLGFIVIGSFLFLSIKSKKRGNILISFMTCTYFIGIQAYGFIFNGDIFEHYLTGLFPLFFLIIAYYLSYLPRKLTFILLAIFLTLNLYKLSVLINSHGLLNKKQAILFVKSQVGSKDFSLESLSTCWRYSGYRYLFAAYANEPVKSYVDPNFAYLYGTTPVAETHPRDVVVMVTHDFLPENDYFYKRYAIYKGHEVKNAIFGNIEVIIMDNQTNWFGKLEQQNKLLEQYTH